MHKLILRFLSCSILASFGCTSDDTVYDPIEGGKEGSASDVTIPMNDAGDGGITDAASEQPPRLLITQAAGATGELAAFNLASGMVDGRLAFSGFGVTQGSTSAPFLIETSNDVVVRLDPNAPWKPTSRWSVVMNDAFDGGESYADPVQVIAVSANKAYVLRYNRNRIAIIDPSQNVDGGAPSGSVDLGPMLQGDDKDGHVDMAGAIYDGVRKRVYVALGNADLKRVDPQGFFQICAATTSVLTAIDTTNDTIVNLGGAGPQGSIVLNGRSPQFGFFGGVVFDAAGDRVLVMSTGCNDKLPDGGPSPMKGRLIEAVSLSSNTTKTLLDANNQPFPGQMLFLSPTKALVQFGFGVFSTTYLWDPTMTSLGPALSTTPEIFAYDGKSAIIGPRTETNDAGKTINVISVSINNVDAGAALIGKDPFTKAGDYFGTATAWP